MGVTTILTEGAPMKHQHGRESAGMIFITRFMNSFLHQASFATGYWYYDRHRSVRLVILVGLAIDQIAQSGLSSLSVIYYSAQLFRLYCCYRHITRPVFKNCRMGSYLFVSLVPYAHHFFTGV